MNMVDLEFRLILPKPPEYTGLNLFNDDPFTEDNLDEKTGLYLIGDAAVALLLTLEKEFDMVDWTSISRSNYWFNVDILASPETLDEPVMRRFKGASDMHYTHKQKVADLKSVARLHGASFAQRLTLGYRLKQEIDSQLNDSENRRNLGLVVADAYKQRPNNPEKIRNWLDPQEDSTNIVRVYFGK